MLYNEHLQAEQARKVQIAANGEAVQRQHLTILLEKQQQLQQNSEIWKKREQEHLARCNKALNDPIEKHWVSDSIVVDAHDAQSYLVAAGQGACLNICIAAALQYYKRHCKHAYDTRHATNRTFQINYDDSEYTDVQVRLDLIKYLQDMKSNAKHQEIIDQFIIDEQSNKYIPWNGKTDRNSVLDAWIDYVKGGVEDGSGKTQLGSLELHILSNIYGLPIKVYFTFLRQNNSIVVRETRYSYVPDQMTAKEIGESPTICLHYCYCNDPIYLSNAHTKNILDVSTVNGNDEMISTFQIIDRYQQNDVRKEQHSSKKVKKNNHYLPILQLYNHYNLILKYKPYQEPDGPPQDNVLVKYYASVQDNVKNHTINWDKHRNQHRSKHS
jgi:hypothetical protein